MAMSAGAESGLGDAGGADKAWMDRMDAISKVASDAIRLSEMTARNLETQRAEADKRAKEADERAKAADERLKGFDELLERSRRESLATQGKHDEMLERLEKSIHELSENVGGVNNKLGLWAEALFRSHLWDKFAEIGYDFTQGGPRKFKVGKRLIAEVDVFLENGDIAMPVEVKAQVREEHIGEHLERIARIRAYLDGRGDRRKLQGAIAGMVFPEGLLDKTMDAGLYAIMPSGDTSVIVKPPEGWAPREW
jgi:hypothetical protein